MVFSSTVFVFFFLPLCLILYYALPWKVAKNIVLLVFSLVFYAWGEPVYVILMILSILANYVLGIYMDKIQEWKQGILIIAVVFNIGILCFFKYAGLFIDTINNVFHVSLENHSLALPIGISFYTFQTLSYIIDLYRGKIRVQKNVLSFGVYISMFPQLIAGPIVRYEDIEKELDDRKVTFENLGKGMALFIFGVAKKVLLANILGGLFDKTMFNLMPTSVLSAWVGLIAYGFQIYFDFSGYSDMAIGLGMMLGFHFPENFNSPYAANSVTDFWRRWHMTLGTWFREYVYIPLGGNRVKPFRHVINILIVWALTGFWHGASWNFLLWGLYYGALLLLEKYALMKIKKMPKAVWHIWTLLTVFLGWGLFLCTSLNEVLTAFGNLFGVTATGIVDSRGLYQLISYAAFLLLAAFFSLPLAKKGRNILLEKRKALLFVVTVLLAVICTAFLVAQNYNPFLYFRF